MVGWRWPPSANGTPGCRAWDSGNSGNSGTGHGVRRSWGISYRNHEDIPILERFPQIFSRNSGYFCRLKRSHGISGLPLTLGVDQWWYQMDSTYKLWWDNGDFCGIYWDTMGYMIMDWFKGKFTVLTACGFCHEIWRCPVQFRNKMPLCHSQFGRYKKKRWWLMIVGVTWATMFCSWNFLIFGASQSFVLMLQPSSMILIGYLLMIPIPSCGCFCCIKIHTRLWFQLWWFCHHFCIKTRSVDGKTRI